LSHNYSDRLWVVAKPTAQANADWLRRADVDTSLGEGWRISGGAVADNPARRHPAGGFGSLEEPACGKRVACRRHVRIRDLAVAFDGSIDVMPMAADPSIGLV
jgi:hypothetical protein